MPNGTIPRRVVVKFHDAVNLPYEDGADKHLERLGIRQWAELSRRFKGIKLDRVFTTATPEQIGELVARATDRDRHYRPPNLLSYFVIDAPADLDSLGLAAALREWPHVEAAYVDPLDASPALPTGTNPEYVAGKQGYLKPPATAAPPAPQGAIDAEFAWAQAGGSGALQKFVDLERGANLDQEDIDARNIQKLYGINDPAATKDFRHGAKVLCLVAGLDNSLGVAGIAFGVSEVTYASQVIAPGSGPGTVNRPDAVLAAINHFTPSGDIFGRVLLLEVELGSVNDPGAVTDVHGVKWELMPMETALLDFEMIRLATALGMIVVEAAGNGNKNLDLFQESSAGKFVLSRDHPLDFKDSGAIMVGGSTANFPYVTAVPDELGAIQHTGFGSRVDCFAWAQKVHTYDVDLFGGDTYASTFGGSSAASAIVAGAALLVQGVAEATLGRRLSPGEMRALLADPTINTKSQNWPADKIGVMPNLKRILQDRLGVAPDVYMRDNVNDTGAVHAGAISLSPDIIVRPTQDPTPAVTFGPGTENNLMLGPTVTAGGDNFVYVRVWNRATAVAAAATNVTVSVFYATPATLILGDDWKLVGSVVIANVPPNNVMTVSNPIVWRAADLPAPGHYCFIALVGNAQDPSPPRAYFRNFDNYYTFIRNNNNVTWRNFDVVANPAPAAPWNVSIFSGGGGDPYEFEFDAPGAYDSDREFQLVVGAALPSGSRVLLEAPLELLTSRRLPLVDNDGTRGRVPIGAHGRTALPAVNFPAKTRARCRLLIQVPPNRERDYEVYVSQLYEGFEVGRVTWRVTPVP
jgi:hypothetical protein